MENQQKTAFDSYQIFMIAVLAFIQFTVVLDFMVLSPLGAILMPALDISTQQFGMVVSAYAFSAGLSGLLAAGFADKYDRKAFLLFFYVGFVFGTILCAMATTYEFLLIARIITGIFGGVIGSVSFAIIECRRSLNNDAQSYTHFAHCSRGILRREPRFFACSRGMGCFQRLR